MRQIQPISLAKVAATLSIIAITLALVAAGISLDNDKKAAAEADSGGSGETQHVTPSAPRKNISPLNYGTQQNF